MDDLYRAMLRDTLANARRSGARVMLSHTPSARGFPEQDLADACVVQEGGSFGERFDHALGTAFAAFGGPVVLVGSDTPHVGADRLRAAFHALHASPAVVGPSREGGFYLVGFRNEPVPVRSAFDMPNEAAALVRVLRARGLVAITEPSFDLDVPEDLVELLLHAELLEACGAEAAARETLRVLARAGVTLERSPSGERRRRLSLA